MVVTNKKGVSSYELSRKLGLRQKTCCEFKKKVVEAMKSRSNNPLTGHVKVDEFYVGGPEEGNPGRGNEKKQLVIIAIQTDKQGINRCYAQLTPSANYIKLQAFLDQHVKKDAAIRTDQ